MVLDRQTRTITIAGVARQMRIYIIYWYVCGIPWTDRDKTRTENMIHYQTKIYEIWSEELWKIVYNGENIGGNVIINRTKTVLNMIISQEYVMSNHQTL